MHALAERGESGILSFLGSDIRGPVVAQQSFQTGAFGAFHGIEIGHLAKHSSPRPHMVCRDGSERQLGHIRRGAAGREKRLMQREVALLVQKLAGPDPSA